MPGRYNCMRQCNEIRPYCHFSFWLYDIYYNLPRHLLNFVESLTHSHGYWLCSKEEREAVSDIIGQTVLKNPNFTTIPALNIGTILSHTVPYMSRWETSKGSRKTVIDEERSGRPPSSTVWWKAKGGLGHYSRRAEKLVGVNRFATRHQSRFGYSGWQPGTEVAAKKQ